MVVSINVESWKECATTSIVCPQERNCIVELRVAQGKLHRIHRTQDRQGQIQRLPQGEKNERHKRFSACATQKEGSCPLTADTG
ncbi:hypothetical protein [Atopobium sp. oral taxon 416]|uniref:hypothetical protein n=1 Tax=Atopobium sp. oral taxon 416 TaxID=712157 RepID=UPI001BAD8DF2|nr:hypothetical protein [Atopobium sp. oral taxon 416]QUC02280.1 hypothetical protein J4859_09485 [Atopobium sp. oral taxon 416]